MRTRSDSHIIPLKPKRKNYLKINMKLLTVKSRQNLKRSIKICTKITLYNIQIYKS